MGHGRQLPLPLALQFATWLLLLDLRDLARTCSPATWPTPSESHFYFLLLCSGLFSCLWQVCGLFFERLDILDVCFETGQQVAAASWPATFLIQFYIDSKTWACINLISPWGIQENAARGALTNEVKLTMRHTLLTLLCKVPCTLMALCHFPEEEA